MVDTIVLDVFNFSPLLLEKSTKSSTVSKSAIFRTFFDIPPPGGASRKFPPPKVIF